MNKRPVLLRSFFALIVIAVFTFSIYPLEERNFFDTFVSTVEADKKTDAEKVVVKAKELKEASPEILDSQALEDAAAEEEVALKNYYPGKRLANNRDVIGYIRNEAKPSIRRGLDLSGGVEFTLDLRPADKDRDGKPNTQKELTPEQVDAAIEALRTRLESQGIYESEISSLKKGGLVSLRAPLASQQERDRILNLIQMSAKLTFKLVSENNDIEVAKYLKDRKNYKAPSKYKMMMQMDERNGKVVSTPVLVENRPQMGGANIAEAKAVINPQTGSPMISLRFNATGAKQFARVTSENVGRKLAIILDGKLYCAPVLREAISGGRAQITGSFSRDEAGLIANALNAGSLQFKVNVGSIYDTDPTLGAASIKSGLYAGIFGLALVVFFMIIYYLWAGVIASISLIVNMALILGAMAAFDATLTLPGIAGIVLTIGMAVDANVLIFERIREESKAGKSLRASLEAGFGRAFITILDANLTTLLTALVLMTVGKGAVKGFAVALSIGIATSMFSTLFLSRLLFDISVKLFDGRSIKMCNWFKFRNVNFLKMAKPAGIISIILIITSIVTITYAAFFGRGIFSVDLTGGVQVTLQYKEKVPTGKIEKALKQNGYSNVRVSYKHNAFDETSDASVLDVVIPDQSLANKKDSEGKIITASAVISDIFK